MKKNYYNCFVCNKLFHRYPSEVKTLKQVCSKRCAGKKQTLLGRVPSISKPCRVCGDLIYRKPSRIDRNEHCSRKCANITKSNYFGGLSPNWKGGAITFGGYKSVEHGKLEHRQVMERILKRKLTYNEIVHHMDEDKLNNNPENLVVMSRSDHMKLHDPRGWRMKNAN